MRTLAELEQLDFAFIDELSAQEHKLAAVEQRLAAMEARRGQVPDVVYQRVNADYLQQLAALQRVVDPLRQRARQIADELGSLQAQFRLKLDEQRLALAELEFRHSLGEFEAAEWQARRQPLSEQQSALETALRRVEDAMQKLGRSSSGGEALAAQLTQETPAHAPAPVAPLASAPAHPPALAPAPPVHPPAVPVVRTPEPPSVPELPPAPVLPPLPTLPPAPGFPPAASLPPAPSFPPAPVLPPVPAAAPSPVAAPPAEPKAPIRRDATFVFKPGRLLPQSAEAGSEPRTLGMRPIVVGSHPGCDVVVADLASRHVEFRLGRSGFLARDVSPEARGFKINGVASEGEVLLADGDTIDIGPARFVLKA